MSASAEGAVIGRSYRVAELFGPTIQGEGELIGTPTIFVRFGGCDYRCSWCDSLHAVLPQYRREWAVMSVEEIIAQIERLAAPPILVTLSGGNPALQPLAPLLRAGIEAGYRFALETQGSVWPEWLMRLDHLVISPKPPSSGEAPDLSMIRREIIERLPPGPEISGPEMSLKVVIFDDADLDFAGLVRDVMRGMVPLSLSVGNPDTSLKSTFDRAHPLMLLDRWVWLAEEVIKRGWHEVRVLPQLHTLAWGNVRAR